MGSLTNLQYDVLWYNYLCKKNPQVLSNQLYMDGKLKNSALTCEIELIKKFNNPIDRLTGKDREKFVNDKILEQFY